MKLSCRLLVLVLLLAFCIIPTSAILADPATTLLFREGEDTLSVLGRNLCGLGDINGDGFDDVAFSSDQPRGTYVFYGGDPADWVEDYFLRGGGDMAAGTDMTGDGIADLLVQATADRVLLYRGFGDSIESVASDSLVPGSDVYAYGYALRTGYVTPDLIGDLVLLDYQYPGGGRVYYYENPFQGDKEPDWVFTHEGYSHLTSDVDFVDFNGDGSLDIVMPHRADLDSVSAVFVFEGPDFSAEPDLAIGVPVELDYLGISHEFFGFRAHGVGDINGDGWEDLAISYQYYPIIYFGGPSGDTLYDMVPEVPGYSPSSAGDANGDGWNDYFCGGSRGWWGAVDLFLGGPLIDSVSDLTLTKYDFTPFPSHGIGTAGRWVETAGDFNNDGYDDLLIAHENLECCDWDFGSVYVIAGGPHIVTGVDDGTGGRLPSGYRLSANRPNPFNPATTIEYELVARADVTLEIFNILGRRVRTLVEGNLAAGSHEVVWDGRDDSGREVSSGVYLYRLRAGPVSLTRKMVLLK